MIRTRRASFRSTVGHILMSRFGCMRNGEVFAARRWEGNTLVVEVANYSDTWR